MRNKFFIVIIAVCLLIPVFLNAGEKMFPVLSKEKLFSTPEILKITSGQILTSVRLRGFPVLSNYPDDISGRGYSAKVFSLYSANELVCVEKFFLPVNKMAGERIRLVNSLLSFSQMKGTDYYSVTGKRILHLIECSSAVDKNGREKPDPVCTVLKDKMSCLYQIRDNRFGEMFLRNDVYNLKNSVISFSTCLHPLKKWFIKIAEKEKFQLINCFFYDKQLAGYLCCSVQTIKLNHPALLKFRLINPYSFANRIRASTVRLMEIFDSSIRTPELNVFPGH